MKWNIKNKPHLFFRLEFVWMNQLFHSICNGMNRFTGNIFTASDEYIWFDHINPNPNYTIDWLEWLIYMIIKMTVTHIVLCLKLMFFVKIINGFNSIHNFDCINLKVFQLPKSKGRWQKKKNCWSYHCAFDYLIEFIQINKID